MLELKNISFSAENETGEKEILKNINLKIKKLSEQIDETKKFWSKRQKFLL